jgi:hypothetical protein
MSQWGLSPMRVATAFSEDKAFRPSSSSVRSGRSPHVGRPASDPSRDNGTVSTV